MIHLFNKLNRYKVISEFLTYKSLVQFGKYFSSGIFAAALEYFSYLILFCYLSLKVSHSISMTLGFILSFILNRFWSFKSKENFAKQFTYMIILFLINLRISNILIDQLTVTLKIHAFISKLLVMGLIMLWNFIIYKKVIYRR